MDLQIPQSVTDARSNAAKLGATAADYASAAYTIPDQLKKTVQEALNYNKDVIGMRSSALADYQAAPAQANAKFGVQQFGTGPQTGQANPDYIFNPFERNSAIQSFITNQSVPFNIANTLLGMREGTIADVVNAGTGAFNAQSTAAQAAAQAARQTYQDVLNEFTTKTQLGQEQQKINLSSANSGGDITSTLAALTQLLGGGGGVGGGADPLDAFIKQDQPAKPEKKLPAVNLSQTVKTSQAGTQPGLAQPGQQQGGWALQPAVDWIRGLFTGPNLNNNFASSSQFAQ